MQEAELTTRALLRITTRDDSCSTIYESGLNPENIPVKGLDGMKQSPREGNALAAFFNPRDFLFTPGSYRRRTATVSFATA